MNKKKFHSLPAKVREVIDKYSGKRLVAESGIALNKNTARFRGKMEKAGDHNFVELSEAQLRAGLKDVWPVHQAWIKRTKDGQVIYDLYKQALADIRAGK